MGILDPFFLAFKKITHRLIMVAKGDDLVNRFTGGYPRAALSV